MGNFGTSSVSLRSLAKDDPKAQVLVQVVSEDGEAIYATFALAGEVLAIVEHEQFEVYSHHNMVLSSWAQLKPKVRFETQGDVVLTLHTKKP